MRPAAQVIAPFSNSISALEEAVVWATVEGQPDVVQEASRRLGDRPERWYGNRERQRTAKEIDDALGRLNRG